VALAWLVVIGSLVLFVLMVVLIDRWSAVGAAYQFVLFPMVTVFLSAWIDHERITGSIVLGGALVVAGVYVGAIGGHRVPRHDAAPGPALPQPAPPC
jgi:drug/metabolite transporter (DMT)-like permease